MRCVVFLVLLCPVLLCAQHRISSYAVGSGAVASGGAVVVRGTVGQAAAARQAGYYRHHLGFWAGAPLVAIAVPNGGEQWGPGSVQTVLWHALPCIASVDISWSTDNGVTWQAVATTANTGSFFWTVPDAATSQGRLRIAATGSAAPADISDAAFTVQSTDAALSLLAPAPGGRMAAGSTAAVVWIGGGAMDVQIDLLFGTPCGLHLHSSAVTANTGSFVYTLPDIPSTQAFIRISHATNAAVQSTAGPCTLYSTSHTMAVVGLLLEGPYAEAGTMHTFLAGQYLPSQQPFNRAPWYYGGDEHMTGPDDCVVDWVLVCLRSSTRPDSVVLRRAALLWHSGILSDAGGLSPLLFPSAALAGGEFYVSVEHRNHMGVMSALPLDFGGAGPVVYHFTPAQDRAYRQFMESAVSPQAGYWCAAAGDIGQDGIINAVDRAVLRNATGAVGYLDEDITLDGIVNAADRIMVVNNRFIVGQIPQ